MISAHGVLPDPLKLATLRDWPLPKTGTDVRSFLGLANYLRDFIPRFSELAAPLESLKSLSSIHSLSSEQLASFNNIKTSLLNSKLLSYPDFSKPFFLATDASNIAVGAVLYQDTEENALRFKSPTRKFIGFFSKSSSPTERRYSANKKELLAVVKALHHFRYYLFGNPFVLVTDHASLKYMNEQKYLNPALANWSDIIFSFTFKVVHCPGKTNFLPDLLSRVAISPSVLPSVCSVSLDNSSADVLDSDVVDELPCENPLSDASSSEDEDSSESLESTIEPASEPDRETRLEILQNLHSFGHFGGGYLQTLANDQSIFWPSLRQDAQSVASSCHQCQLFNQHVPSYAPLSPLLAQKPFSHVVIDLIGPLPLSSSGNYFTLVLVDVCTRFVFLESLPNKSAFSVASVLFKIFCRFGFPKVIQSDNGTEFVNSLVDEFCSLFNMHHRLSLPYHPRCNGIVEREVKTTIQVLCKQLSGLQDSWCKQIPAVEFSLNAKTNASFQFSSFALMFMRTPLLPVLDSSSDETLSCSFSAADAVERFVAFRQRLDEHLEAQVSRAARSSERFSRTKRIVNPNKFSVGDQVYKLNYDRKSKLDPVKAGPFIVESVHNGRSLVLRDPSGAILPKKVPISHVSKFFPAVSSEESAPIFHVERILNHREHEGKIYYLVKWLGYDSSSNTWEPTESFIDTSVVDRYWESLDLRGGNVNSGTIPTPARLGTPVRGGTPGPTGTPV